MSTTLKPCPFCGSDKLSVIYVANTGGNTKRIWCQGCSAEGPWFRYSEDPDEKWNRRPDSGAVEWQPIETAPEIRVVLTQHYKDLFPVAAFKIKDESGGEAWFRETEGPEDVPVNGKHDVLRRAPTHWRELDDAPAKLKEGGAQPDDTAERALKPED